MGTICVLLLLCAGVIEGSFGYRQARAQMAELQRVQAVAAAREIDQYLQTALRALQQVQALPWGSPGFDVAQRRLELQRLLALNPGIVWARDVGADGLERLFVSRTEADRVLGGQLVPQQSRAGATGIFNAGFDQQGVPNALLTVPLGGDGGLGVRTDAVLNLRFLADVVSGLRSDDGGQVYVVDAAGVLLAHPDPTLVLSQRSVADRPAVAAARRATAASAAPAPLIAADVPGLLGGAAISTAAPLASADWLLFVEQQRATAMRPAVATLERTLLLLAAGGCLAVLVSAASARRMAAPIARLREATARLAHGDLGTRIDVRRDDEIGRLAEDFNTMSARLQQSYAVLEDRVDERTAELQLQRSEAERRRQQAERANETRTLFFATASHDLRQPLHAIGLLVGGLRAHLREPAAVEINRSIESSVRHMDDMFVALLHISNLEAGKVTPRPVALELQSVLDRAMAVYGPMAAARGLSLRSRPTRVTVCTDPTLLDQIVGNLCVNAVRYTQQGGVLIGCRRRGEGVVLQVWDTGIGIAADQLEAIFDEFVRIRSAHQVDGLGLGLAIVRSNARLLGLGIAVRSRPQRGSCFEVGFAPSLLQAAPAPRRESGPGPEPDLQVIGDAFVFVVDDDRRQREATAMLLRQQGAQVVDAATPASAIALARTHLRAPDLIVTDLQFEPGAHADRVDGLSLVQHLRAEAGCKVPALLVTADTSATADSDDAIAVLHKPASPSELLVAVSALLRAWPPAPG